MAIVAMQIHRRSDQRPSHVRYFARTTTSFNRGFDAGTSERADPTDCCKAGIRTVRVWVVRDLEPLPIDDGDRRLMRNAKLCDALVRRGHEVHWITSTFDHYSKRQRAAESKVCEVAANYTITLLRAPGYRSNRSPLRVWHNHVFARAFRAFADKTTHRPDVIVTDLPTTETAKAAIQVARLWNVPSLLSIRDLWPDFFADFLPLVPKPLLRLAVSGLERQAVYACRHATAVVGISSGYLEWGLRKGGRQRSALDGVVPLGYRRPPMPAAAAEAAMGYLRDCGVDPDKSLVAFVGSWGASYDLETVLEAASRLSDRTDIQFVLAGTGEARKKLEGWIGKLDNVVAPGWLSASQIAVLLERTAVGLTSYREAAPQGLPNKIFEYMAHGVFQISTLRGEAAELLTGLQAGVAIASGDPQAMTDAILDAVEEAPYDGRREHIRKQFLAHYDGDAIYAGLVKRIETLAGNVATNAPPALPPTGTGI